MTLAPLHPVTGSVASLPDEVWFPVFLAGREVGATLTRGYEIQGSTYDGRRNWEVVRAILQPDGFIGAVGRPVGDPFHASPRWLALLRHLGHPPLETA